MQNATQVTPTNRNEDLVIRYIVSKLNPENFTSKQFKKVSTLSMPQVYGAIGTLVKKNVLVAVEKGIYQLAKF